ncbi:MAG: hypothetical protein K8H85_05410 [Cyclobacteriaceae bacterium]|nr:hypothetical protein [Cyclobacteriaceae bacterium]
MRFFVLLTGFREGTEVVSVLVYAPPDETLAKVNRADEPGDVSRTPGLGGGEVPDVSHAKVNIRSEPGDIRHAPCDIRREVPDISRAPCDVTGAALDRRGEAEDIGRAKVNIRSGPGGCRLPVTSNR